MGAIAKYFALMNEEQVDRVLTAQEWCAEEAHDGHARCLVGHAEQWCASDPADFDLFTDRCAMLQVYRYERSVPTVFDRTARRFGLARAVQLVKQRAAQRAEELRATPLVAQAEALH